MNANVIAIVCYGIGIATLALMFTRRRLSLMLSWPFLLYSFGLIVPVIFGDRPEFTFTKHYYNDQNLIIASLAALGAILLFLALDILILGRTNLAPLLAPARRTTSPLVSVVNGGWFSIFAAVEMISYGVLSLLAWDSGEIGAEYTFRNIEYRNYTGPLAVVMEGLTALALLYLYARWRHGRLVRRRRLFEVLFAICLVGRALPGSRFMLVKSTILLVMLLSLVFKPKLSKVLGLTLCVAAVYGAAAYIGYRRIDAHGKGEWFDLLLPLCAEAYFGSLTLLMSTNNIVFPTYQLGLPIAVALYIFPAFAFDKNTVCRTFFDRDTFASTYGFDSIQPVGGMHFLGDSMIAYGPFFMIAPAIVAAGIFLLFRSSRSSVRILLALATASAAHQLWRESYANGIKTLLEPYLFQYLLLWLVTGRTVQGAIQHSPLSRTGLSPVQQRARTIVFGQPM